MFHMLTLFQAEIPSICLSELQISNSLIAENVTVFNKLSGLNAKYKVIYN